MATESERHLERLINDAGLVPFDLGVDGAEAWAKFFHRGRHELIEARYGVDSTDETVAVAIIRQAAERGLPKRQ